MFNLYKNNNKTKGFTIVELIVVLAILGILMAIAIPMYGKYIKQGDEANTAVTASAINNAVITTLFEQHGEPTFTLDSSTPEFDEILRLSEIDSDETLEFRYYSNTSDLPTVDNFSQLENTWVVYIPQDSTNNTFNFEEDVVIYPPSEYQLTIYSNGLEIN